METTELVPIQPDEPRMKQLVTWDEFRDQAEKLKATAETLTVTNSAQVAEMKLARVTRLTIKNLRVAITKKHQELKSGILEEGRRIDAGKNELLRILEPLEDRLLLQETFAEREQTRIQEEKRAARAAELAPYFTSSESGWLRKVLDDAKAAKAGWPEWAKGEPDVAVLTDDQYATLLRDSISVHTARVEREQAEKVAVEAARKAEAERIEAQRIENEKLRKEAAEREVERKAAEIEQARLRKQIEDERKVAKAKSDAEAARLRSEKLAAIAKIEAQAKKAHDVEIEAHDAALRAERDARAKIEAEIAARKAEEARIEAEANRAAELAALAPDKEKILAYANAVWNVPVPAMTTSKSSKLTEEIISNLERFVAYVRNEANNL